MKKIALLLVIAIIMSVFAACSCGPNDPGVKPGVPSDLGTETAPTQTQTAEETSADPNIDPQTTEAVGSDASDEPQTTEEPVPETTDVIPDETPETDITNEEDEGGLEVEDETIIEIGENEGAGSL